MSETESKNKNVLVKILDYDPAKHRLKVVKADDNQPLRSDFWSAAKDEQEKVYDHHTSKTIKASPAAGAAILEVEPEMVSIRGSADSGFYSTKNSGNIIKGSLSIEAEPAQIKIAGLYRLNPLITSGFASSIVTPIPFVIFDLPGAAMVAQMAKDIAVLAPLLSMGG